MQNYSISYINPLMATVSVLQKPVNWLNQMPGFCKKGTLVGQTFMLYFLADVIDLARFKHYSITASTNLSLKSSSSASVDISYESCQ